VQALKMLIPAEETSEASDDRMAIPSESAEKSGAETGGNVEVVAAESGGVRSHHPGGKAGVTRRRNIELLCETCNRTKSDLIR